VKRLIWNQNLDQFLNSLGIQCFDVIIGSDILYYYDGIRPLLETIHFFMNLNRDLLCILSSNIPRFRKNEDLFFEVLRDLKMTYQIVSLQENDTNNLLLILTLNSTVEKSSEKLKN